MTLRKATNKDEKEIARQDSIYWGMDRKEEDISIPDKENVSAIYIAETDNTIIGKVCLEINEGVGGIYGLRVLPDYRSKGYGRDILILSIEKLKENNSNEIMLQVDAENKNALNLYKSCGFEETYIMDYYKLIKENYEHLLRRNTYKNEIINT